jgi:pimeloyl-ACP methyl ester carboxylesterase
LGGRVEVRGAQLRFERSGEGPDLVWGHGLSMNLVSDAEMAVLHWERIPVSLVRYDARGHGGSDSTPQLAAYRWSALARDQLALADALGIGDYVAAGASMGCGTALHVAVLAPERVRALVLVIPPTGWETRAAQAAQWEQSAVIIEREGVEPVIAARALLPLPDPYAGDDVRRKQQAANTRSWDPARLARVMRGAALADMPERAAVATIGAPVLILAWTGDPIHPESTARELAGLMPQAELHVASTRDELNSWSDRVAQFLAATSGG